MIIIIIMTKDECWNYQPDNDNFSKKVEPTPKMTTFFRSLAVELDRDPSLYPEGNTIEVGMSQYLMFM